MGTYLVNAKLIYYSDFFRACMHLWVCSFYNKACEKDRFRTSESMQFYLKYEVYRQDCLLLEGVSPLLPSSPFFWCPEWFKTQCNKGSLGTLLQNGFWLLALNSLMTLIRLSSVKRRAISKATLQDVLTSLIDAWTIALKPEKRTGYTLLTEFRYKW